MHDKWRGEQWIEKIGEKTLAVAIYIWHAKWFRIWLLLLVSCFILIAATHSTDDHDRTLTGFLSSKHNHSLPFLVETTSKGSALVLVGIPYFVAIETPWIILRETSILLNRACKWLSEMLADLILRLFSALRMFAIVFFEFIDWLASWTVYPVGRFLLWVWRNCIMLPCVALSVFVWNLATLFCAAIASCLLAVLHLLA